MTTVARSAGDLSGRVALVTGGSRGLGREISFALAAAGASVVVASRKLDACEATATAITHATGRDTMAVAAHVGDWNACRDLVERSAAFKDRLDIVVNCAGIAPRYEHNHEVTEALFDKTIEVNLKGPFRIASLAAHSMAQAGGGSIINISSVAAVRPSSTEVPYGAAKAGLQIMSLGLAQEYGPTVRINTIMAGPFLTDIAAAWDREAFDRFAATFPLRRGGDPHEIVGAALYFAGDASSFTTGAVLTVDGGLSAVRPAVG